MLRILHVRVNKGNYLPMFLYNRFGQLIVHSTWVTWQNQTVSTERILQLAYHWTAHCGISYGRRSWTFGACLQKSHEDSKQLGRWWVRFPIQSQRRRGERYNESFVRHVVAIFIYGWHLIFVKYKIHDMFKMRFDWLRDWYLLSINRTDGILVYV